MPRGFQCPRREDDEPAPTFMSEWRIQGLGAHPPHGGLHLEGSDSRSLGSLKNSWKMQKKVTRRSV